MPRKTTSVATKNPVVRCAIYTRKSTEEGLEQEFNSLDAQRESGEAFITAQRHEGWQLVPDRYDDGGFTGGNMDRPALKRLMADIAAGKDRLRDRLQGRSPQPVPARLRPNDGGVRPAPGLVRLRHSTVQHRQLDGPTGVERPLVVRPVRT